MRNVFASFLVLILTGCTDDTERLSHSELETLFAAERKVAFTGFRFSGTAILRLDKTAALEVPALGKDVGTWWFKNDTICSKWKKILQGNTVCAHIGRFPDGSYIGRHAETGLKIGDFNFLE